VASRVKALIVLAAPFLLTFLLLAALSVTDMRLASLRDERDRREWQRLARQGLHRLRASHTIDSQLEMMGVRFESLILEAAKRSRKGSLFDSGIPEAAFQRAYPPTHRPAGTLVVSFGVSPDGRFKPLRHPSFPRMKLRLMAELLDFYRTTAESGTIDQRRMKALMPTNALIFGPWTPPRVLAGREGRVTPTIIDGRLQLTMWRTINHGSHILGAVLILWPGNLSDSPRALRHTLELADRSAAGLFHPLLIPLPGLSEGRRPLLARSTAALARIRPASFRKLVAAAPSMKQGRLTVYEEFLVFRESFSPQHPFDMLAIAPLPQHPSPLSGLLTASRALLLLGWGITFLYVMVSGRPPPVSLRTMLRTQFLLVASLPLGMLATFGYLQISTETQRAVDTIETGAIDSLNALDILSRQSLGRFSRAAQQVFSSPSFIRNVLSSSSADVASAAAECYGTFSTTREPLNNVLIFQPGSQGRSFSSSGEDKDSIENLDFFAGIINLTHNSLISRFGQFGNSSIMLDTENQKSWRTIFESFGVLQFSDLFFSLMETGHMTSIGSEDIGLHVSQMFFESGVPRAYVLLNTPARGSQKTFLTQEINRLNLQHPARHACGDVTPGGATPHQPPQNAGFWNSEPGRLLRQCMDHAALADTPITIRRGTLLAVAAPCRTLGPMVTASLWSVDGILDIDARNKSLLALFTALLGVIAYRLARLTADHLVTPLEAVDRTLRNVSSGNLTVRTGLERPDELGQMTVSFDAMIDGLRERRELGKFVSGAIESSLDREDMETARADAFTGTILVSDIRSFTTMSESHPPAEIVDLLNTHMEAMTSAILRHGGHVDRFIGDAVVALFRATGPDAGAHAALLAALEMNAEVERINRLRAVSGSFTYAVGIGIATGELMAGTLAGSRRRDYVVIGTPRGRAEALENLSKRGRHSRIIADEATVSLAGPSFVFEPFPREQAAELVRRREAEA